MGEYIQIKPSHDRWGRRYGGGGGWHWYDFLIGAVLFVLYILAKEYF